MSDFVNLFVGNIIKITVGNKYLTLRANGYSSVPEVVLDSNNCQDYFLELLHADSSGSYGLFGVFDKNDNRLYDTEVYKDTYNKWLIDYFIFKPMSSHKPSGWKTFTPDSSEVKCTCKSRDLFNYGCKCGAFKKEVDSKKPILDDGDYF
jgi:hypothetical protein